MLISVQPKVRNLGDKNEFIEQRNREVMQAYRHIFKLYGGIVDVTTIYRMVALAPSSRFFVSDDRAYRVVSRLIRDNAQPIDMQQSCKRMYYEIMSRILKRHPHIATMSTADIRTAVRTIIREPAPEMYLSTRTIASIISEETKKCYEKRRQRFLR